MTWLAALNFILLQWFFVRLARVVDDSGEQIGWTLVWGWMPLTGWL